MRSMTGYGRSRAVTADWCVDVELSGGNRKQIDLALNCPASLLPLEGDIRTALTQAVSRGRIVVKVTVTHVNQGSRSLIFDEELARQYIGEVRRFSQTEGLPVDFSPGDLLQIPGVFQVDEVEFSPESVREALFSALEAGLNQFRDMQLGEGRFLREDLLGRITLIERVLSEIRSLSGRVPVNYRKALMKRLSEAGLPVDLADERILREIALFAERCDITEELTRVASHITLFRQYVDSEEPVGRLLDFLCQEMHREINTIGSKANDATIARCVVEAKSELEKIREQVQNVQ